MTRSPQPREPHLVPGHVDQGTDATPDAGLGGGHGDVQTRAIAPAASGSMAEATSGSYWRLARRPANGDYTRPIQTDRRPPAIDAPRSHRPLMGSLKIKYPLTSTFAVEVVHLYSNLHSMTMYQLRVKARATLWPRDRPASRHTVLAPMRSLRTATVTSEPHRFRARSSKRGNSRRAIMCQQGQATSS